MRPPRPLKARRAALISTAGHIALLGLLFLAGSGNGPPAPVAPIVEGVLVTFLTPAAPAAPFADAPESAIPVAVPTPQQAPEREPPAPPSSPPVPERLADDQASAPSTAAESAPTESAPLAPSATAEPERAAAERTAEEPPAGDTSVVRAADEPEPPGEPFAPREQRIVQRKLASWTGRFTAEEPTTTLTWRDDGQDYTAVLKRVPAADAMGMEQLAVEITTERDGNRMAAELRMNRIAFSNFAQFIDRWDPDVQIHDDVIDGRFHSNSEINVSRSHGVQPVFTGKVTLAARDIRSDGVGYVNRRTLFPAGIETSVRRIALPARAAALDAESVPMAALQRFERDTLITFHDDGNFSWREIDAAADQGSRALGDEPFYIVGADKVAFEVQGIVNGKVLVYSPERIVITGNLRYADDPRLPGAGDYLGLVAERSVEIDEPEVTGLGDLEVHASIYARNRFAVRSYRSRPSGTLFIYGSVTAGSVSATEPRFATTIEFDDRLTTMRAPGFPLSDRYELDTSSGEWRAVPAL